MSAKVRDVLSEVDLQEVTLERINVEHIDSEGDQVLKVKMSWKVSFQRDGEYLLIKPIFNCDVVPAAVFKAETEYRLVYKIKKELTDADIEQNLEELAQPCASRNTLLIGIVSQQIIDGSPLIPIPFVDIKNNDE